MPRSGRDRMGGEEIIDKGLKLWRLLVNTLMIFFFFANLIYADNHCHPAVDFNKSQLIVGYGSLMEEASKQRTESNVSINYPIILSGYQRGWFLSGCSRGPSLSTTYLGVIEKNNSQLNAVIYKINDPKKIIEYDKREQGYCRKKINPSQLHYLVTNIPDDFRDGDIWIYASKPENIKTATAQCPIVQSYVDIFINGCLELENKFALPHFAEQCIATTANWSSFWVNDRLYPRRAHIYQPNAEKIDRLLSTQLPDDYKNIKIEG